MSDFLADLIASVNGVVAGISPRVKNYDLLLSLQELVRSHYDVLTQPAVVPAPAVVVPAVVAVPIKEETSMSEFDIYIADLRARGLNKAADKAIAMRSAGSRYGVVPAAGKKVCVTCKAVYSGSACMNPACLSGPDYTVRVTCADRKCHKSILVARSAAAGAKCEEHSAS